MKLLILLALLTLTSCQTIQEEVTPERCQTALETAETVESIAHMLVTFGYEAEKARALAVLIQHGREAIGLVCSAVNSA